MSIDLVMQVARTMEAIGHTQREVAGEVGMSQGHISKILSKTISYGKSAQSKLRDYVERHRGEASNFLWGDLIQRVRAQPESAQIELMHIMHHALRMREEVLNGDAESQNGIVSEGGR